MDEDEVNDEAGKIFRWRFEQFIALGYSDDEAVELAQSPADLHELAMLVRRGCAPAIARQIVL